MHKIKYLTTALTLVVLVLAVTATPGQADTTKQKKPKPPSGSSTLPVSAEFSGYTGTAKKSGLTGCEVTSFESGRLGSVEYTRSNGQGRRVTSVVDNEATTDDGRRIPDIAIDGDDIGSSNVGEGPDYDREEIVDGIVELESGSSRVYEVTECDQYEDGQTEIVVAPDQATFMIPSMRSMLAEQFPVPELILQPFDKKNDWTYVQAPIDIRVTPESLAPLTLTADTGGPDFADLPGDGGEIQVRRTMTATATPRKVIFKSGDPIAKDTEIECTPEEAVAPYVEEDPGACSYRYFNSSSVTDSGVFEAEVLVEWDIQFTRNDGPGGTFEVDPSFLYEDVRVAEIKVVNI